MSRTSCVAVPPGSTTTRTLDRGLQPAAKAFVAALQNAGITVTITSTRRSLDTQRALYANYLRGCSNLPAAKPGKSKHAIGRAFDLHLDPPVYELAGAIWESIGGVWGGRFSDPVHFEA